MASVESRLWVRLCRFLSVPGGRFQPKCGRGEVVAIGVERAGRRSAFGGERIEPQLIETSIGGANGGAHSFANMMSGVRGSWAGRFGSEGWHRGQRDSCSRRRAMEAGNVGQRWGERGGSLGGVQRGPGPSAGGRKASAIRLRVF